MNHFDQPEHLTLAETNRSLDAEHREDAPMGEPREIVDAKRPLVMALMAGPGQSLDTRPYTQHE